MMFFDACHFLIEQFIFYRGTAYFKIKTNRMHLWHVVFTLRREKHCFHESSNYFVRILKSNYYKMECNDENYKTSSSCH